MSYADDQTNKKLSRLERKLTNEYRKAWKELRGTCKSYFEDFEKRDLKMKAQLEAGEVTKEYYQQWRLNQLGRGERWEALRDQMARRATAANQIAAAYVNETTKGIYALNRNWNAYVIEQIHPGVNFTMVKEHTIKVITTGRPYSNTEFKVSDGIGGFTFRRLQINPNVDYNWNSKQIQFKLIQGILQGDSVKQMTDRFMDVMQNNRTAAIRNARTAITSAQNAGSLDAYKTARDMGIRLRKQWMCTQDDRTRDSHAEMDGETVDLDESFSNGLMYPGDPAGEPIEVYNCRCTMKTVDLDLQGMTLDEAAAIKGINPFDEKSFKAWQKGKGDKQ